MTPMLDSWMEVLLEKDAQDAQVNQIAASLEGLPISELAHLAKHGCFADGGCGGAKGTEWLERYTGTELFEPALALEQQRLSLEQQRSQNRVGLHQMDNVRDAQQQVYDQLDQLSLQKALLDIQLLSLKHQAMSPAPVQAAPALPAAPEAAPPKQAALSLPRVVLDAEFSLCDAQGRAFAHMFEKDAAGLVSSMAGGAGKVLGGIVGGVKGVGNAVMALGHGAKQVGSNVAGRVSSAVGAARSGASNLGQQFAKSYGTAAQGAQHAAQGGNTWLGKLHTERLQAKHDVDAGVRAMNAWSPVTGSPMAASAIGLPSSGGTSPIPMPVPRAVPPGAARWSPTEFREALPAAAIGAAPVAANVVPLVQKAPPPSSASSVQPTGAFDMWPTQKASQDMDAVGRLLAKMAANNKVTLLQGLGNLASRNVPALIGAGTGAVIGGAAGYHEGGIAGGLAGAAGGGATGAALGKGGDIAAKTLKGYSKNPDAGFLKAFQKVHNRGLGQDLGALGIRRADHPGLFFSPGA